MRLILEWLLHSWSALSITILRWVWHDRKPYSVEVVGFIHDVLLVHRDSFAKHRLGLHCAHTVYAFQHQPWIVIRCRFAKPAHFLLESIFHSLVEQVPLGKDFLACACAAIAVDCRVNVVVAWLRHSVLAAGCFLLSFPDCLLCICDEIKCLKLNVVRSNSPDVLSVGRTHANNEHAPMNQTFFLQR